MRSCPKTSTRKQADPQTAALISAGVAKLDQAAGGKFASVSAEQRTAIVTANQTDPFVQLVRGQCITSLYDNDMAYAHFGYQGEAFSKGGYIFRGFNDLTWLPNPPAGRESAGRRPDAIALNHTTMPRRQRWPSSTITTTRSS